MIALAYLESQCTYFLAVGWTCWFLRPIICSRVSGLMRFRDESDKGTASDLCKSRKESATETLAMIRQAFGRKVWTWHGKSKFTETVKGETGEEQSEERAHYFLWHQGDCSQRICPGRPNSHFRILLVCCITITHRLAAGNFWQK
jgi:hypothetical protein